MVLHSRRDLPDDSWEDVAADTPTEETPDPWAPAPAAAANETVVESWASTADTGDAWASEAPSSSEAGEESSFFSSSIETATEEADPLAAMVREAVERVTEGDGAN